MSKPKIKLWFSDMWGYDEFQFNPMDNYFTDLFSAKYDVVLDEHSPDLLVYSCFSRNHLKYNGRCKKLFYSGENITPASDPHRKVNPDFNECDLFMGKFPTDDRCYYHPLWVLFVNWFNKTQPRSYPSNPTFHVEADSLLVERPYTPKSKFCCFINNNPIEDRVNLFNGLHSYKHVDSYGYLYNNVGYALRGSEKAKIDVVNHYKFTIAFENSFYPGYITEKLVQPYSVGSIPIYSGGLDETVFNKKSMVYRGDYQSIQDVIDEVKKIDQNDDLYQEYMSEPLFNENRIPDCFRPENVLKWIEERL